jgi:hypothetical protein
MTPDIKLVIEKITAEKRRIAENEGNLVLNAISMGKHFAELKSLCPRRWLRELDELGFSPRTASRYLQLGTSWWANQTPRSDVLSQLPVDLHKLEYLCRLSSEQLVQFLKIVDCKDCNRSELITMVLRLLGERRQASKPAAKKNVDLILKEWDRYVCRTLEAIEELGPDAASDEIRAKLTEGLHSKFAEVEDMLNPVEEEAQPPSDQGTANAETTVNTQEAAPTA